MSLDQIVSACETTDEQPRYGGSAVPDAFADYYRCSDDVPSLRIGGVLSNEAGYFRFG